jgi:hypothetical protein
MSFDVAYLCSINLTEQGKLAIDKRVSSNRQAVWRFLKKVPSKCVHVLQKAVF